MGRIIPYIMEHKIHETTNQINAHRGWTQTCWKQHETTWNMGFNQFQLRFPGTFPPVLRGLQQGRSRRSTATKKLQRLVGIQEVDGILRPKNMAKFMRRLWEMDIFWQNFGKILWEYHGNIPKFMSWAFSDKTILKKTAIGMSKRWNNGENMWKQTQVMTGVCCVPGLRQEDIRFKINSWWGSLNSNDSLQDFLGPKSAKSIYMSTPPTIPYVPVAIKGLMSICCCHSTVHASGIEVLVVLDHFLKIICMTKNWLGYLSASLYIISDIVLIAGKTTHDLRFLFSSYTYIYVLRMLKK